ncbi:MAG: hypothetical protein ABSF86_08365 [Steroidobacteraceae bacterium]|jgi:hypothetical protein
MKRSCKWVPSAGVHVAGALVAASAALLAASAALADEPAAHAAGVWQKHDYSFAFMGFTSTYSCDGLADKLKTLLIAAGARADAKSSAGACAAGFGRPDKLARADLSFYTLAPDSAQAPADAKRVEGTWRPVSFSVRSPRGLALGDCEVVEQFVTAVLPMFTVRNLENRMTCVPHQESGSNIDLKFDSFTWAPGAPSRPK